VEGVPVAVAATAGEDLVVAVLAVVDDALGAAGADVGNEGDVGHREAGLARRTTSRQHLERPLHVLQARLIDRALG
jgi:hypothetical protein